MIDENEIMPYNFFKYGGVYSGSHEGMRYIIKKTGDKPDFMFSASVWQGPYSSCAVSSELITTMEFDFTEDGRLKAIQWLKEQYNSKTDYWKSAKSILNAEPVIHE